MCGWREIRVVTLQRVSSKAVQVHADGCLLTINERLAYEKKDAKGRLTVKTESCKSHNSQQGASGAGRSRGEDRRENTTGPRRVIGEGPAGYGLSHSSPLSVKGKRSGLNELVRKTRAWVGRMATEKGVRCAGLVEDQKWAGGEFKATVGNDVTRMSGMNFSVRVQPVTGCSG